MSHGISIRDHMVAQAAGEQSFFDALRALRLDSIEIEIQLDRSTPHIRRPNGSTYSVRDPAAIDELKNALAANGVRACALLAATDFSSDDRGAQEAWAIAVVRAARALGAPAVRVDPLTRNRELPAQAVRENFVAGITRVLRETAEERVDLGIENHGPVGNDPAFLDGVFAAVNDPRLGMTLDTGNFYWWGVPLRELYELLRKYAPRAKHTHIKNINYPPALADARRAVGLDYKQYCCPLDEGNLDLSRVVSILREAGYQRDLCIEDESLFKFPAEQKLRVLERDVAALRAAE